MIYVLALGAKILLSFLDKIIIKAKYSNYANVFYLNLW